MTGHVSIAFPGAHDHRTRSSTVNKSPSESMSFITEVICKFIFTDVHMRNNYRPNRAFVALCANGDHLKMGKEHFSSFFSKVYMSVTQLVLKIS